MNNDIASADCSGEMISPLEMWVSEKITTCTNE